MGHTHTPRSYRPVVEVAFWNQSRVWALQCYHMVCPFARVPAPAVPSLFCVSKVGKAPLVSGL